MYWVSLGWLKYWNLSEKKQWKHCIITHIQRFIKLHLEKFYKWHLYFLNHHSLNCWHVKFHEFPTHVTQENSIDMWLTSFAFRKFSHSFVHPHSLWTIQSSYVRMASYNLSWFYGEKIWTYISSTLPQSLFLIYLLIYRVL